MKRTARHSPRHALEASLEIVGSYGSVGGRTQNVSRGGLAAYVSEQILPGHAVFVRMSLVFDEDTFSEPLELPARVVWCTPIGDQFQLGVAFLPISAEKESYLSMFLRYLDGDGGSIPAGEHIDGDDPFG